MGMKRIGGIGLFKFQQEKKEKEAIKESPEKVKSLGESLVQEKVKNMRLSNTTAEIGSQLTKTKVDNMMLKREIEAIKASIG